ncbi:MAG TPA: hypothetical protein VLT88_10945, partial [Desulfosarcina sp.]|nr:hypothetical protein [Desulfosarcina sp.]
MAWAALGLTVETAIFVVAGWAWLRSLGYTFAEAAAGGILLVFMGISLIHQISFCAGSPVLGAAMEAIALAAVAAALLGRRPALRACLEAARAVAFRESPAGPTLLGAWLAMGALAVGEWFAAAGPPSLFTGSGASTVLASGSLWGMPAGEPVPLLNAPALFFHTARLGLGPGACGYGVLAHMAIGFSTYALARRYAWPPMALTVTLMVLSMPRLVFLSLHPS